MGKETNKPRLVFFQWRHDDSPGFLQLHMQLHIKCLSEFFDVTIINRDCDYQKICDIYQPDLALFESGYRTSLSRRITIRNINAYPEIPKLGLHNGDPWCDCRIGFISDMERWGIETFFSISATIAEHTPELADNIFVWPNYIDSSIYRDYSQTKIVPVLFNGAINSLYPWRQKIYNIVSSYYPSLIFPHLGYESHSPLMIYGEQYARTINASWFVPACGTVAKDIIRKHFEVPGSKACLITEKTTSLEAAGFVDMENCVFADEKDVLGKLNYLFKNTHELERIIHNGYELVHSRHTLMQRDQILQWFNLNKNLKSNHRIIQESLFGPLRTVEKSSGIKSSPIRGEGLHLVLLRRGDEMLREHKYDEAETLYLQSLNYIPYMHEPKLKLAICNLYKGNAVEAHRWVKELNLNNFRHNKGVEPDPVEWAYLLIALLCQGKINEAIIRASQFPLVNHPELDNVCWIINYLQNERGIVDFPNNPSSKPRFTIHLLSPRSHDDWVNNLCRMLKACKQFGYVEKLRKLVGQKEGPAKTDQKIVHAAQKYLRRYCLFVRIKWLDKLSLTFEALHIPNPWPGLPPISEIDYIIRLGRWVKDVTMKTGLRNYQSRVRNLLKINKGELRHAVQGLLQNKEIQSVIIIGSPVIAVWAGTLFKKMGFRYGVLNLFWIHVKTIQLSESRNNFAANFGLKYYECESSSLDALSTELNNCIRIVKKENNLSVFDLALIDGSMFKNGIDMNQLRGARFIIFKNINTVFGYKNKQQFMSDPRYTIVCQDPMSHNGYAIFKKLENQCMPNYTTI
jgi:hypothetical protein